LGKKQFLFLFFSQKIKLHQNCHHNETAKTKAAAKTIPLCSI
jgi:hypothetical protein